MTVVYPPLCVLLGWCCSQSASHPASQLRQTNNSIHTWVPSVHGYLGICLLCQSAVFPATRPSRIGNDMERLRGNDESLGFDQLQQSLSRESHSPAFLLVMRLLLYWVLWCLIGHLSVESKYTLNTRQGHVTHVRLLCDQQCLALRVVV